MQDYFYALADYLTSLLKGGEVFTCAFAGEDSDFIRFNGARVRQAGHVAQRSITLDLIEGRRHAAGELTLAGDLGRDRAGVERLVERLRETRSHVPEDPFLYYATEVESGERLYPDHLPEGAEMVGQILNDGEGHDLVGILAKGPIHAGFANSLGQRNWYSRPSFNLTWSLYLHTDKAVKTHYAGFEWQNAVLQARMEAAVRQLETLTRPAKSVPPGRYRVFLTPKALDEIMVLLGRDGFGMHARRTRTTPLLHMVEEGERLNPALTVTEDTAEGIAPDFQAAGFIRPPQVTLIEHGAFQDCLVAPRSTAEYGVPCNGADHSEAALSIDVAPGSLLSHEVLQALDTGLYVGNLWYLNYSDRNAARITGMTRFATFWVEDGRIEAPVNVMRFDETVYHLLGDRLLGLTAEREMLLDPISYGARSSRSARLPGILVEEMNFTL